MGQDADLSGRVVGEVCATVILVAIDETLLSAV